MCFTHCAKEVGDQDDDSAIASVMNKKLTFQIPAKTFRYFLISDKHLNQRITTVKFEYLSIIFQRVPHARPTRNAKSVGLRIWGTDERRVRRHQGTADLHFLHLRSASQCFLSNHYDSDKVIRTYLKCTTVFVNVHEICLEITIKIIRITRHSQHRADALRRANISVWAGEGGESKLDGQEVSTAFTVS